MTVRISYDEGNTRACGQADREGARRILSMTVLPDGSVGLVYETGTFSTISFVRFKLDWITDGQEAN